MRYKLILFFVILFASCAVYKPQYYMHEVKQNPINIIDSINRVHDINIPLSYDRLSKTILPSSDGAYTMYHYACYKDDTLYVASITFPSDTSKYIVKLRKELNR